MTGRGLRDRIFPTGPPRDGYIARTAWVGGWESQFRGLGRLTAFLSDYLLRFSAAIDDIALSIVFLQRHRVEVGLKLLIERAGADVPAVHDIPALATACDVAFAARELESTWTAFWEDQREFIELMHDADPSSASYRYPVDRGRRPSLREEHIDIRELESAGLAFEAATLSVVATLAETEPLPRDAGDGPPAVDLITRTLRAMASAIAASKAAHEALRADNDRMGVPSSKHDARMVQAMAASEEQTRQLQRIDAPLLALLSRLDDGQPRDVSPRPITPAPRVDLAMLMRTGPLDDPRVEWAGRLMGEHFRELKLALLAMRDRSGDWETPSQRQLHADISRSLSRM